MALAILGILTTIAVPAVTGLNEKWRLEEAAWRLASDLRLARQVAISTGRYTQLSFRWEAGDYRLDLNVERSTVKLPAGVTYVYNNFPETGGTQKVSFSPIGAPTRGGTVGLKNKKGTRLYVILAPATGRVRVSPTPPD